VFPSQATDPLYSKFLDKAEMRDPCYAKKRGGFLLSPNIRCETKSLFRQAMSNESSSHNPDPEKMIGKTTNQSQEATEMDLWDLDFAEPQDTSADESPRESAGLPARRKAGSSKIQSRKPVERHIQVPAVDEIKSAENPAEMTEAKEPPTEEPEVEEPEVEEPEVEEPKVEEPEVEEPEVEKAEATTDHRQARNKEWQDLEEERVEAGTADVKPSSILASLSKVEKIAISSLIAVFTLGATLTVIHFSNRVPTRPLVAEEIDYPVSGKIIEIHSASTFWRKPITTGEDPDVVRRGTELIPVLKMNIQSQSGAIRVFFRNEEGLVVGDGITRAVKGGTEISIPATAGFEDIGMHTAYRTGDSLPWVVQVFEGPSTTAPRAEFRKVLETEISTLIR
jgi:hypothetical protein